MSQALHTASTGINAGQSQINVIANNVANINTVAYKSANMTFETLFSNNLSYGSAATKAGGGTNPKQIGLGVKIGGITRNFTPGTYVQTGRDMDCMISGTGFFVVQDASGKQYFTRDGVFSLDSEGNVVTQSGMKAVAAKNIYSNASNNKTVKIPKNLSVKVEGDANLATKRISELNNASITTGTISATVSWKDDKDVTQTKDVILTVPTGTDGDPTVGDIIKSFNGGDADGKIPDTEVAFKIENGAIKYEGKDAKIVFHNDGTTSNFVAQTGISGSNPSNQLSQTVTIQEVVNYNDKSSISLNGTAVDENGIIVATYSDGSVLTQYVQQGSEAVEWKYTTKEGVVITGSDVRAASTSIQQSNFALELATMVNQEGLVSLNNNLWQWGPDVGEIFYGMAGEMSFGSIESGGYEESNVDIATELSNMISAQRMIQMNSRVFSTASSVMEALSYLGS